MRMITFVCCVVLPGIGLADEWQPPENPDPSTILQEAKADATRGNFAEALAKQVWYHEHAVTLQPSQSGVRRSFALSHWLELGEKYPPALTKLREIRDATEKTIRDENRVRVRFDDFHDLVALNRTLRQEELTAETFKWLSDTDAEDAVRVYGISEAALIKQKEYTICGRYIKPDEDVERIGESYASGLKLVPRYGSHYRDYVEKNIVNDAAMLVAILVKNERQSEAEEAATELRKFVTDQDLSRKLDRALEAALSGTVPTPWP